MWKYWSKFKYFKSLKEIGQNNERHIIHKEMKLTEEIDESAERNN